MRNICPECEKCPDRMQSITKCFEECGYPMDVLMAKERKRNSDRKRKEKKNDE